MPSLVLASSSPYRRELLSRLRLPFTWSAPSIDETPFPRESADALVRRLAAEKAGALAQEYPHHLLVGSDQVAVLNGRILGKPHDLPRARAQLQSASGNSVTFLTGLALLNTASGTAQIDCIPFTVHFRHLDAARIERYLAAEQPFDCAGSFKSEGLGVSLFRATEGEDATSLIGLPLIRLVDMLLAEGVQIP
ncbi:Maf-like protein [Azotobacter vinelandii CA]|uniref:7-methyl-GTP pyrophosphatase n=2 Tax=Azotobacter vinelandii TaxID=354 RepID=C1DR29_AZOVD|nr:nucleoside triphosphate pyrophosphatase [Azotobacter vinelandii]ACO77702.1 Maf-like protein [Azotobacter vinelandii DJ]AGK13000.1 Maf-like protein [Azotobacter vinelandii CA]AGK19930.1 Maf-like protein [Azotobacter vinelandii CA6]WKN23464.1 Maf-like protein [Azotobacter vinelandii]SFX83331.1 MAF protein [Azotobacter vinelandii]